MELRYRVVTVTRSQECESYAEAYKLALELNKHEIVLIGAYSAGFSTTVTMLDYDGKAIDLNPEYKGIL